MQVTLLGFEDPKPVENVPNHEMWLNHRIALDEADIFKNFKNVYQPKMGLNIVRNSKYGSLEIC